jgi:hypothetical protein
MNVQNASQRQEWFAICHDAVWNLFIALLTLFVEFIYGHHATAVAGENYRLEWLQS